MSEVAPPPYFTPEDLRAAVILIDHACDEGAFRGWANMQRALEVRNRLLIFADQWSSAASQTTLTKGETSE